MRTFLSLLTLLACLVAEPAFATPADDVKALLLQGKSAEAYRLANRYPTQFGIPSFDFYFGIAAINAGHAGEGVFALERYIVYFPHNVQARLELARGYFIIGNDSRAREEFHAVMKTHPDSAVTTTIERYLDAIRAREQRYKPSASAFLEAGIGYDSNINSGVDNANVSLPVLGNVTLLPAGVKKSDGFTYLALGGQGILPLAPGVVAFGALRADTKLHFNDDQFNQNNYNISGGMTLLRDKNFYRATLAYGGLTLDNNRYRDVAGLTGDWRHQWDKFKSLDGYAQYLKLDYTGTNTIRDSDFYSLGMGVRFDFVAPWQPSFYARAFLSREDNAAGVGHLSRDLYGLRLSASASPAPKWALSAGLTYQHSDYDAPEPVFQTTRKDKYYLFDIGGGYALTPALSLRAEWLSYKNDSNLALYEYRRDVVAMKLRYDSK